MLRVGPAARTGTRAARLGLAVLLFVGAGLALVPLLGAQNGNPVVIEGAVTRGVSFARSFGPGFGFRLQEQQGVWVVEITHAASGEKDLIYPVNPPYRFSNHQHIGPGYGESARDSASITPRDFVFLARPDDVGRAWDDVERVLWPYAHGEAEVQRATDQLTHFPTGTLRLDILAAEFAACDDRGHQPDECVSGLRFRATIIWPATP
jgi:hypothetical protein